ncbi:MAG: LacI family DNA-binding transcriptional regulator, partial [Edaphobacter sp.]
EETSAHVRKIIKKLNYIPNSNARNLRVGRTRLFGLIISDINNPFFPELIDAFEALATEQAIDVIFTHTNYDPERLYKCMRRMVDRNVDGIAVMTSEVDDRALEQAAHGRIPLVLLNQKSFEDRYCNIPVEYSHGFREAIEHLQFLGHQNIGFIAGPSTLSSARRRRDAFIASLKYCGLSLRREWIATGDLRVEGGKLAMQQLLATNPRPTAVVTTNDLMAVGALQATQEAGVRVPEEMSIVGFDDLPIASMVFPPLSTIHLPRREIARNAFTSLLQAIQPKGKPAARSKPVVQCPVVYPRLVVRQSSGKVARGRKK